MQHGGDAAADDAGLAATAQAATVVPGAPPTSAATLAEAVPVPADPSDDEDEDEEGGEIANAVGGPAAGAAAAAPGDSPVAAAVTAATAAASVSAAAVVSEAHRTANRATDPTLVQRVAEATGVDGDDADCPADMDLKGGGLGVVDKAHASPSPDEAAPRLSEVLLSLGWTFPDSQTVLQGRAPPDYLDGSCLIYAEDRLLDIVDFRGAHSAVVSRTDKASSATFEWSAGKGQSAGVLHSGDVMSAEGGTHVIRVRLADLPPTATDCFFVISAYNCRNLSLFRTINMRLLDAEHTHRLLSKFTIADAGKSSAVVVCSLSRRLEAWSVRRIALPCDATVRDYGPVEAALAPLQAKHSRWRRRGPFVLLNTLLLCGRATPREEAEDVDMDHKEATQRSGAEEADVLMPLLKLPAQLFQCVVQLI